MQESENLAGWLMLSCLSLFVAVMIVLGCLLGMYFHEVRSYELATGEPTTVLHAIWADFGPRKQIVKRIKPGAANNPPPWNPPLPIDCQRAECGDFSCGSSPAAAPSPPQ